MVSRLIREALSRRAARFNLVLDDVSLTHVAFSPAFSEAVEAKTNCAANSSESRIFGGSSYSREAIHHCSGTG